MARSPIERFGTILASGGPVAGPDLAGAQDSCVHNLPLLNQRTWPHRATAPGTPHALNSVRASAGWRKAGSCMGRCPVQRARGQQCRHANSCSSTSRRLLCAASVPRSVKTGPLLHGQGPDGCICGEMTVRGRTQTRIKVGMHPAWTSMPGGYSCLLHSAPLSLSFQLCTHRRSSDSLIRHVG